MTEEVTYRVIQHSVAYAERYWELSKRAKNSARRQNLAALAKLWTKLAAEYEADQPLLNALSEINFDEPFMQCQRR